MSDGSSEAGTRLRLNDARLVGEESLCLAVVQEEQEAGEAKQGHAEAGYIVLEACGAAGTYVEEQHLSTANISSGAYAPIVHVPSGSCATPASGGSNGDAMLLGACDAPEAGSFLFGASGRLCLSTTSLCVHTNASWPDGSLRAVAWA